MAELEHLILKAEALLDRLADYLPASKLAIDWNALAWRWQVIQGQGHLHPVANPHKIQLADICNVDAQKAEIVRNTEQFVKGFPANNVLLTGARGTG